MYTLIPKNLFFMRLDPLGLFLFTLINIHPINKAASQIDSMRTIVDFR